MDFQHPLKEDIQTLVQNLYQQKSHKEEKLSSSLLVIKTEYQKVREQAEQILAKLKEEKQLNSELQTEIVVLKSEKTSLKNSLKLNEEIIDKLKEDSQQQFSDWHKTKTKLESELKDLKERERAQKMQKQVEQLLNQKKETSQQPFP